MPVFIPPRIPFAMQASGTSDRPAAKRNRIRSGFSLIEVLVAMSLAAVVLLGTAEMLIRSIQVRGSAEDRIALTEAACAQLERRKGADPGGPDLEIGSHEAAVENGSKGMIELTWDVAEAGPGALMVSCAASGAGRERNQVRVSVLISRHLGF